jgi:hypothetical protein
MPPNLAQPPVREAALPAACPVLPPPVLAPEEWARFWADADALAAARGLPPYRP